MEEIELVSKQTVDDLIFQKVLDHPDQLFVNFHTLKGSSRLRLEDVLVFE